MHRKPKPLRRTKLATSETADGLRRFPFFYLCGWAKVFNLLPGPKMSAFFFTNQEHLAAA
jgi:hypothetical protein